MKTILLVIKLFSFAVLLHLRSLGNYSFGRFDKRTLLKISWETRKYRDSKRFSQLKRNVSPSLRRYYYKFGTKIAFKKMLEGVPSFSSTYLHISKLNVTFYQFPELNEVLLRETFDNLGMGNLLRLLRM